MIGWIILGTLAAYGGFCLIWCLFGWLLPKAPGCIVCRCASREQAEAALLRYGWLRNMGLLQGSVFVVGEHFPERFIEKVTNRYSGVEFCSLEALADRLELERDQLG